MTQNVKTSQVRWQWLFWLMVALLGSAAVLSRFIGLADKPFHHDESLHAYYSTNVAAGYPHMYSALLHGPFLYYFVGLFLAIFPQEDFYARLPAAIFGVLVVCSPLLIYRKIGRMATLVLMTLLLVSPTTLYFGRFLREDVFTSIWVLGTVFGLFLYWQTKQLWTLYFSIAMLAFHFTNKENSFLHTLIWGMAIGLIAISERIHFGVRYRFDWWSDRQKRLERLLIIVNCVAIFVTIFILFFSSFFRHQKGSWTGILDGLYRESLLYWWDQNKVRRIDGPFDYHLPLLANYEFLLLPFLATAWVRIVRLSHLAQKEIKALRGFICTRSPRALRVTLWSLLALTLGTMFLPRIGLVERACHYTEFCYADGLLTPLANLAHLTSSRHILQIILYCVAGGIAFWAALISRRKVDAFLWFWLTGAIGVYSYVGEKVPWLLVYILLPLILVCGLELTRIFTRASLKFEPECHSLEAAFHKGFSNRILKFTVVWLILTLPFTVFKAWRVAFPNAANTAERLVFTQTTPEVKKVRDRWYEAKQNSANPNAMVKVLVTGEATWPMSWYIKPFEGSEYGDKMPSEADAAKYDAMFLDEKDLDMVRKKYLAFDIYTMPLRSWWVPGEDPSFMQLIAYFSKLEIYPAGKNHAFGATGEGSFSVLYLERFGSKLASLGRPAWLTLTQPARPAVDAAAEKLQGSPTALAR